MSFKESLYFLIIGVIASFIGSGIGSLLYFLTN